MAGVAGDQNFLGLAARQHGFRDRQGAVEVLGVDHHLVGAVLKPLPLRLREAEAPARRVVACDVGDRVRQVGLAVEMRIQLGAIELAPEADRIVQEVKVVLLHVQNALAGRCDHVGFAHPPLLRHGPIEDLLPARHLDTLEIHDLAQHVVCLAHALAGQAAQQRPEAIEGRRHLRGFVLGASPRLQSVRRHGAVLGQSTAERLMPDPRHRGRAR